MKTCFECRQTKPDVDFYLHPTHRDGLSTRCRVCTSADMQRRWRAKHPEPPPYVRPTEKLCRRCQTTKPLDEFHVHTRKRDGRQAWCKTCQVTAVLSGYKNDPAKHAAYNREWDRRNPDKKADSQLKARLGLPHGTYARMFAEQQGRCAICGTTETSSGTRRLHVDHDAETGTIRGLLCGRCNTGIGQFLHDTHRLRQAITYLEATDKTHPKAPEFDTELSILQPNC